MIRTGIGLVRSIERLFSRSLPIDSGGGSRYYFTCLTDKQKEIYNAMLSGIRTYSKEIRIPLKPIDEVSKIFNYMLLDNPMIFYVSSSFRLSSGLHGTFIPDYKYARHLAEEYTVAIKKYLSVFDGLKYKSDLDKEIFVHDYCLNNFSYDYAFKDNSFSVLGPVINKTAVCEGIAKFVKLAFDCLGVQSLVVSGKAKNPVQNSAMEGHAWNIVKIGGKAYHLDVTFDMTIKGKRNRYDYFNLSDEDIKKDHVIADKVPACTTVGGDYFSMNSLVIHNPAELEKFIGSCLIHGKKNIMLKLKNVKNAEIIVDKVISIAQRQYIDICKRSVMVEVVYNESQMVFEIGFNTHKS